MRVRGTWRSFSPADQRPNVEITSDSGKERELRQRKQTGNRESLPQAKFRKRK